MFESYLFITNRGQYKLLRGAGVKLIGNPGLEVTLKAY